MKAHHTLTSRLFTLAVSVVFCWFGSTACPGGGGGGAPAVSGPDVDFAVSQYTAAKTALQAGDLDAAKVEYEKVLAGNGGEAKSVPAKVKATKSLGDGNLDEALSEYEKTVAGTPDDPKANFGLGLINLALLGQNAAITDLLAEFGQPAYNVTNLFGPSGFFAKLDAYHETCKNKPDLDAMPFGDMPWHTGLIAKDGTNYGYYLGMFPWKYTILTKAKDSLTTETIRKKLTDIVPDIKGIIAQWEIAAKDPDFSFVLPKELLYGNTDITFRGADLQLGISALYGVLASINVANSWTNDITLGTLFDPKGSDIFATPSDKVAEKLNTFFVLKPDNQLADAKVNIQNFLQHGKLALEQYVKKPDSAFVASDVTMQGIQDLLTMGSELLKSFDGPTKITATEMKDLTVDLKAFFDNPVSASKVAVKPYEATKGLYSVHPVDAFFKEFLKGAVETSGPLVGPGSGKFFTKAILNLRSYSQKHAILEKFYNTLIDPKFAVCSVVKQTVGSDEDDKCTPKCDGKQCGSDGCGGSCGTCKMTGSWCDEKTAECVGTIFCIGDECGKGTGTGQTPTDDKKQVIKFGNPISKSGGKATVKVEVDKTCSAYYSFHVTCDQVFALFPSNIAPISQAPAMFICSKFGVSTPYVCEKTVKNDDYVMLLIEANENVSCHVKASSPNGVCEGEADFEYTAPSAQEACDPAQCDSKQCGTDGKCVAVDVAPPVQKPALPVIEVSQKVGGTDVAVTVVADATAILTCPNAKKQVLFLANDGKVYLDVPGDPPYDIPVGASSKLIIHDGKTLISLYSDSQATVKSDCTIVVKYISFDVTGTEGFSVPIPPCDTSVKCNGMTCGVDDGCGGVCECKSGFNCNASKQCVTAEPPPPAKVIITNVPTQTINVDHLMSWQSSNQITIAGGEGVVGVEMTCANNRVKLSGSPAFDPAKSPQDNYAFLPVINVSISTPSITSFNTTCTIAATGRNGQTGSVTFPVTVH